MPSMIKSSHMTVAALALLLLPAACQRSDADADKGGVMGSIGGERGAGERSGNESRGGGGESGDRPARQARSSSNARDNFNRNVRIINGTDQIVVVVRARVAGMSDWGRDRIPTTVLQPGQEQIVDFNDNNGECNYDLQATLMDQSRREHTNVNICRVAEWRIGMNEDVLN
jgi:hypothetical protein